MSNAAKNVHAVSMEAARWLERGDCEDWNEADQRALDAWLDESPTHKLAYWRVRGSWEHTQRLVALRSPLIRDGIPKLYRRARRFLVGLGVVIAVGGGIAFSITQFLSASDRTYATGVGVRETITLSDGSQIDLNTDTSVRVAQSQRKITLDRGEAFFLVKHDATRPFVVVAGDQRIVDLGTKFAVRRYADHTEVALVEGRARVEALRTGSPIRPATLTPGEIAIGDADALKVISRPARDLADELSWRRGVLVFRRATLAGAVEAFNRYNTHKLVVAGSSTGTLKIGGTFQINNPDTFARVARDILELHIEHRGDETVISR